MENPFPAYKGDEPYIFVCYAHKDRDVVYPEMAWLRDQGLNVWYDEGISPGEEWSEELGQAIQDAQHLLMFVTPNSVASRHCRNELHFAQNHDTAILAVHLTETELPAGLELAMGSSQAIIAHDQDQATSHLKMIQALGTIGDPEEPRSVEGIQPMTDSTVPASRTVAPWVLKGSVALGMVLVAVAIAFFSWERTRVAPQFGFEGPASIAVLPFANRSVAAENAEFLAEGIHDELVTRLGAVKDLKVISRTSMLAYRDTIKDMRTIAQELGVASVLEGSVQRAGNSVRINAKLIEADTETQLWADTFDRSLTTANLFAIQGEISMAIAVALKASLSPSTEARLTNVPTDDLLALEAYFKGKQLLEIRTSDSLVGARTQFQQAIERDPSFAHAFAGLAEAWLEIPNYTAGVDPSVVRQGARYNAERAIALNPELPEALAVLGWERLLHRFDWRGAEDALSKALEIQPGNVNALHWMSHVHSWQGDHDQAIDLADRVAEIDPLSTLIGRNLAYIHMDAGHFDLAVSQFKALLKLDPYSSSLENLWTAQLRAGRFTDAGNTLDIWAATRGRDTTQVGRLKNALEEREMTKQPVLLETLALRSLALTPSDLAQILASLQDSSGTLAALSESYYAGTHSRSLLSMRINPSFNFLRDDERFNSLLEKIGLNEK